MKQGQRQHEVLQGYTLVCHALQAMPHQVPTTIFLRLLPGRACCLLLLGVGNLSYACVPTSDTPLCVLPVHEH